MPRQSKRTRVPERAPSPAPPAPPVGEDQSGILLTNQALFLCCSSENAGMLACSGEPIGFLNCGEDELDECASLRSRDGSVDSLNTARSWSTDGAMVPGFEESKMRESEDDDSDGSVRSAGFRARVAVVAKSKTFDDIMLVVILVNCIMLAMWKPKWDKTGRVPLGYFVGNSLLTALFVLECVIKLTAEPVGYWKEGWNWLDFIVVCESVISSFSSSAVNMSILKVFRLLRPLRTINKFPQLQLTVAMLAVLLLFCSLLAMLQWGGSLQGQCMRAHTDLPQCESEFGAGQYGCVITCDLSSAPDNDDWEGALHPFTDDTTACFSAKNLAPFPSVPRNTPPQYEYECVKSENPMYGFQAFDNLLQAALTLTQVMFMEGWADIMLHSQESNGTNVAIFFIAFILVVSIILTNIVVAALLSEFNKREELHSAVHDHDDEADHDGLKGQMRDARTSILSLVPFASKIDDVAADPATVVLCYPIIRARKGAQTVWLRDYMLDEHRWPNLLVNTVITVNIVLMAMDGHGISDARRNALQVAEFYMATFFLAECALKIGILGTVTYFGCASNSFDFVLVLASILELSTGESNSSIMVLRTLRFVRLGRIIRAGRQARAIQEVLLMVELSLAAVWPALLLMRLSGPDRLLFMFIGTLTGMQLFGTYNFRRHREENGPHSFTVRFDTFTWSYIQVTLAIIGESWSVSMYETMREVGAASCVFYVAVVVIGRLLMANVVLASLLNESTNLYTDVLETKKRLRHVMYVLMIKHRLRRYWAVLADEAPGGLRVTSGDGAPEGASDGNVSVLFTDELMRSSPAKLAADAAHGAAEEPLNALQRTLSSIVGLQPAPPPKEDTLFHVNVPETRVADESASVMMHKLLFLKEVNKKLETEVEDYWAEVSAAVSVLFKALCGPCIKAGWYNWLHTTMERQASVLQEPWFERVSAASAAVTCAVPLVEHADMPAGLHVVVVVLDTLATIVFGVVVIFRFFQGSDETLNRMRTKRHRTSQTFFGAGFGDGSMTPRSPGGLASMRPSLTALGSKGSQKKLKALLANRRRRFRRGALEVVVLIGMIGYRADPESLSFMILRSWRSIIVIQEVAQLALLWNSLLASLSSLTTMFTVLLLIWPSVAIMGMELFKGRFRYCTDPSFPSGASRYGLRDEASGAWKIVPCEERRILSVHVEDPLYNTTASWVNADYHFDNFGSSLMSVFLVMVGSGYSDLIFPGIDHTRVDRHPRAGNHTEAFYYFAISLLFLNTYFMQLFMNLVWCYFLDTRNESITSTRAEIEETLGMNISIAEGNRRRLMKGVLDHVKHAKVPPAPVVTEYAWRLAVQRLATSPQFLAFIDVVIFINTVQLSTTHSSQTRSFEAVGEVLNMFFTAVFLVECVVKLVGLGVGRYFNVGANIFDFVVTVFALIDTIMIAARCRPSQTVSLMRSLRCFRVLRLCMRLPHSGKVLWAIQKSSESMFSVLMIMLILVYVFAAFGEFLFKEATLPKPRSHFVGFDTYYKSMMMLFLWSTGELWDATLVELLSDPVRHEVAPNMSPVLYTMLVYIYVCIYVVLMQLIILNLFIMIICDAYDLLSEPEVMMSYEGFDLFELAWAQHDTSGTGKVTVMALYRILRATPKPYGVGHDASFPALEARVRCVLGELVDPDRSHGRIVTMPTEEKAHTLDPGNVMFQDGCFRDLSDAFNFNNVAAAMTRQTFLGCHLITEYAAHVRIERLLRNVKTLHLRRLRDERLEKLGAAKVAMPSDVVRTPRKLSFSRNALRNKGTLLPFANPPQRADDAKPDADADDPLAAGSFFLSPHAEADNYFDMGFFSFGTPSAKVQIRTPQ